MAYTYMVTDPEKVSVATTAAYGMLSFIQKHPKGFNTDDIFELIKLWTLFGINIRGDGYWSYSRAMWLSSYYPFTPTEKPSVEFANRLRDFTRAMDADDDTLHDLFTSAENGMIVLVVSFRHKLKLTDPAADKEFTQTLIDFRSKPRFQ